MGSGFINTPDTLTDTDWENGIVGVAVEIIAYCEDGFLEDFPFVDVHDTNDDWIDYLTWASDACEDIAFVLDAAIKLVEAFSYVDPSQNAQMIATILKIAKYSFQIAGIVMDIIVTMLDGYLDGDDPYKILSLGCFYGPITIDPIFYKEHNWDDTLMDEKDEDEALYEGGEAKLTSWSSTFYVGNIRDLKVKISGPTGGVSWIESVKVANIPTFNGDLYREETSNNFYVNLPIDGYYDGLSSGHEGFVEEACQPLFMIREQYFINFENCGPDSSVNYNKFIYTPMFTPRFDILIDGEKLCDNTNSAPQTFSIYWNYWGRLQGQSNPIEGSHSEFPIVYDGKSDFQFFNKWVIETETNNVYIVVKQTGNSKTIYQYHCEAPWPIPEQNCGVDLNGWYYKNLNGEEIRATNEDDFSIPE
jgi:hypothetical protein